MPFLPQPQEKCNACNRTVYATERIVLEELENKLVYHKTCVRCQECNKVLKMGDLSSMNGKFWCVPHFKQLFATKGNYEEGFGKEKHSSKWKGPAVTTPASFVPSVETEKPMIEKKETSGSTAAKIRKFQEDAADSEKCVQCNKRVYLIEKIVVEEKELKKIYHKNCLRCETCGKVLNLGGYVSLNGVIYCKPHGTPLMKERTDVNRRSSVIIPEKLSFVPKVEEDNTPKSEKKETSEATAAKIRKWRNEGNVDCCPVCSKTVYLAEKLVVEERGVSKTYHKSCYRCASCDIVLDIRNSGSANNKVYCLTHLKEVTSAPSSAVYTGKASFVPEVKEDNNIEKGETPAHIAAKFKNIGGAEKCEKCDQRVYATEKIIVEELNKQHIYHKNCLRCSHCNIKLDASNYGTSGGVIYCPTHLKNVAKPTLAKDTAYFVSPLHQGGNATSEEVRGATEVYDQNQENEDDQQEPKKQVDEDVDEEEEREKENRDENQPENNADEEVPSEKEGEKEDEQETPKTDEESPEVEEQLDEEPENTVEGTTHEFAPEQSPEDEPTPQNSQEKPFDQGEEPEEPEEKEPEEQEEPEEPSSTDSTSPTVGKDSDGLSERDRKREDRLKELQSEEEERQKRLDERRRQREERRQKEKEEEARREAERERRAEERRKRLEAVEQ